MLIKLTNANPELQGNPILINTDMVLSVYKVSRVHDETQIQEELTHIFCPPHGTWEVQETVDQIYSLIEAQKNVN